MTLVVVVISLFTGEAVGGVQKTADIKEDVKPFDNQNFGYLLHSQANLCRDAVRDQSGLSVLRCLYDNLGACGH